MGADIIGIIRIFILLNIIARMLARMSDVQKLRQKSQSNNLEIIIGALAIISLRMPSFPISKIIKAEARATYIKAESIVIKYTVDIIL